MFFIAIGAVLFCGAFFRWRWLVDPPTKKPLDLIYSQARLKAMFGTTAVLIFTYFLGAVFIFCGVLTLHPTLLDGFLGLKRIYPPP
jgi:hypothetical protein